MSILQDVLSKLSLLSPQDRGLVAYDLLNEPYPTRIEFTLDLQCPSIVKSTDVCGGSARLIRTRIPVWTVERMRQLGVSPQQILFDFPSLLPSDLDQAWRYARLNREEIEREIEENERDS